MKCAICGEPFEDGLVEIVNGEPVHPICHEKQQEEEKMKEQQKIVDAEYTEVPEEAEGSTEQPKPKCEVTIGMEQDGGLYFTVRGVEPSLLNIEGLLKFAQLKMRKIWDERLTPKG
jgi:formylmethanofuran dehydrogenase subunit E